MVSWFRARSQESISLLNYSSRLAQNGIADRPEVLPEYVKSTPLNRIATPDELRGVVTWLASDASSFCTGSE